MRLAFLVAPLLLGAVPAPVPAPPSILLVTIDTLRADRVGCYGYAAAETPNLDRLAREGVRFDEARSHVPLTLPSHATILTGLLPPHHGERGNGLLHLSAGVRTLASALGERGYNTGAVVSSVVLDRAYGLDRGFATYDDNQHVGEKGAFNYLERGASQVADAAARELSRLRPPFFLWVHLYDPHRPWIAPAPFRARHAGQPYDAEIAFADAALGEIQRRAQERSGGGLIVAVTADHGESLGDHGENQHGYTLHRGVLRVPLVVAGPGIPNGVTVRGTVGLVDVAPTLADLAGAPMQEVDGISLCARWAASPQKERAPLWEETLHPLYDSGWAPLRGLLTPRWHFVEAPRPELYDRETDPDDKVDIAARHPEIVSELRGDLKTMAASMRDVPEPPIDEDLSTEEQERRAKIESLGYLTSGAASKNRSSRLDPKDGLPGFLAVEAADPLIDEGKGKEARDLLEPFARKDPGNPRLWHQLGRALQVAGDLDGAAGALRRAVDLDPRSEFIRYTFADLLRQMGDEAGAEAQLARILRADPRAVEATLTLAEMAARRGAGDRALAILQAAYDAGARDPALLDLIGSRLLEKGRAGDAGNRFAEALVLYPGDPTALLESGRAALRESHPNRAIEMLNRCTNGPRAFECRIELARAYVIGPRELGAARSQLEAARGLATTDRMRQEVDRRLAALQQMRP